MNITKNDAYLRLHCAVLLAGATGLFGRFITLAEIPLVWYRMLIAGIVMSCIMYFNGRLHRLPRAHFKQIVWCGFLLVVHWVFFYASIKASNVSIGVISIALDGFSTALLDPIISRRRYSLRELTLSLISFFGILFIFGFDSRYRLGITFGVLCSFFYALFSIYSKRAQEVTGHKSSTMLVYELGTGWLMLTLVMPIYAWLFPYAALVPTTTDFIALLIFGSVFTIGPFLLQLQALRSISAFTVNLTYNLEPIYSIVFAMIIFNEAQEVNVYFWVGLTMIITSVVLQTVFARKNKG